jgi:hypothetical protein
MEVRTLGPETLEPIFVSAPSAPPR